MSTEPLITIGIPTYNRPDGLRKTLEKITRQTYSNLEIVVSDNCSPDEEIVRSVVESFSLKDQRIKFYRQPNNLGSIGNFHFLVSIASGKYFLWAADDDEVEINYVEELWKALMAKPTASIAMSYYKVTDLMSEPPIVSNISIYLDDLVDSDTFGRLKKYICQPDHFGKTRLVWGLFSAEMMALAFNKLLATSDPQKPSWADLPIDFALLCEGDIAVVPKCLFHAFLLPTSDGKNGLNHTSRLFEIVDRSFASMSRVIQLTPLKESEKRSLVKLLNRNRLVAKVNVKVYYTIQRYFPYLARLIKKAWYFVFLKSFSKMKLLFRKLRY
jgi:glycosyltransferase involved in cell wall biosynthesis